jgi:type II secretory pathway component PulM
MNVLSRWQAWSLRERSLIALAVVVIVLGAGWPLLWAPIERDVAQSDLALARARADAAASREAAAEIASLARTPVKPRNSDLSAAFDAVIDQQALRDKFTSANVTDGRIRVTFAAIDATALAALVDALGREELLFVRDALLAARVEPGLVRAELTLARDPR